MLGAGVYVSRDEHKTHNYGRYSLKLLVYTGNCKVIRHQGDPMQKTWQDHGYDSAWVPPNCGMVSSGMEENCIKSPKAIMVLGMVRGHELLPSHLQERVARVAVSL